MFSILMLPFIFFNAMIIYSWKHIVTQHLFQFHYSNSTALSCKCNTFIPQESGSKIHPAQTHQRRRHIGAE